MKRPINATSLWVKLENGSIDKVKTCGCQDVGNFAHAIKKTFPKLLEKFDAAQLSVFMKENDDKPLPSSHLINTIPANGDETALYVKLPSVSSVNKQVPTPFDPTVMVVPRHGIVYNTPHLERSELLAKIETRLAKEQFALLSTPSGSGKTSMFALISHKNPSVKCRHILCLPGESLADRLRDKAGIDLEKETCPEQSEGNRIVFIDDAEITYWDKANWTRLLKGPWLKDNTHIKFIIATTHTLPGDPVELLSLNKVAGLTRKDFLLSEAEVEEFLNLPYGLGLPARCQQFSELRRIIIQQCAGLVGALRVSFQVIDKFLDCKSAPKITEQHVIRHYLSPVVLEAMIRVYGCGHLHTIRSKYKESKEFSLKLFSTKTGTLPVDFDEKGTECFRNLQKAGILKEGSTEFSSPLARRFFVNKVVPWPLCGEPFLSSLFVLIRQSIESISASQIAQYTVNNEDLPKEATFQHLLMMALAECIHPHCGGICPEISTIFPDASLSDGAIDFFLLGDIRYGIELLVNGDGTKEHLDRFDPINGRYSALSATDYVVVDFRASEDGEPVKLKMQHDKRITVFFKRGGDFKHCQCLFGRQETPVCLNLKP